LGGKYKDKNGKYKDIPIDDNDFKMDFSGMSMDGGSGDDGGDIGSHPSIGANYYAGSLADGEITGRYLLYQRDESLDEDPTTSKTVTLLRDVGAKFNMAGDGATFLVHIQRTAMTAGAKGDITDIQLNYDEKNVAKEGYFTTTSYYPIYIKAADLATTDELDVPINGIGENLSGKNFLAPHLKLKFNGDGTMTYYSVTGYDNDGNTAGATGANYEIVVDAIATFSTQSTVAQIPSSINFFTGLSNGSIALSGVSKFYENSSDGIQITRDGTFQINNPDALQENYTGGAPAGLNLQDVFNIPKEELIIGYRFPISIEKLPKVTITQSAPTADDADAILDPKGGIGSGSYLRGINNAYIEVLSGQINITFSIQLGWWIYNGNPKRWSNLTYKMRINKITPYQG